MNRLAPCLAALLIFGLGGLAGCGGSGDEDYDDPSAAREPPPEIPNDQPVQSPTALNCPTGTFLTYRNFGQAFTRNHCTTCHGVNVPEEKRGGAPAAANFDTAEDLALWRAAILQRATGATADMPPTGQTSTADRDALAEWLNCGTPE